MHPTKALDSDGITPIFFQRYWPVIGGDIIYATLEALNTGIFLDALNYTFISLIPKKKNLKVVFDYRPISLCNVFYKIVAKVFANRLKVILPKLILCIQSVFVLGRLIFYNS